MTYPDDFINKIICGDCLEVMKDISDKSIDMVLCDLHYGTTACSWDTIIPFEPLWEQYKRIIKDNGAIVLTASQPFTSALVMSNIKMFKYEWIWKKPRPTNPLLCMFRPMNYTEDICVFYYTFGTFNKQMAKRNPKNNRNNTLGIKHNTETLGKTDLIRTQGNSELINPSNILEINTNTKEEKLHPTQKPVALFEYLIKTYTNEGDLVLDNCAGSGTTGVACQNLNRNFILIEKEPKYIEIIKQRLRQEILL